MKRIIRFIGLYIFNIVLVYIILLLMVRFTDVHITINRDIQSSQCIDWYIKNFNKGNRNGRT